jgi:paraquat-inducible protein B
MKRLKTSWTVWLFPVIAILVTGWLFGEFFRQRGPMIQISFDDAATLQPEKTRVRFRGVDIGVVKDVSLADDNKSVIAHVMLERDAARFAVEGSRFWVVVPKVNLQGISGLETLFEGSSIAVAPGAADAPEKREFKGQIGNHADEPNEDSVTYFLETDNVGAVGPGDLVTFRGLKVGSVTKLSLTKDSRLVVVQIAIQTRYVKLVRTNSAFWRKVAIQANLGLFSSEVKINSLDSLLNGGIDLSTPDSVGPIANAGTRFTLLAAPPKNAEKWNPVLEF